MKQYLNDSISTDPVPVPIPIYEQLEKQKEVLHLVSNMVKLGSLYSNGDRTNFSAEVARERMEFQMRLQKDQNEQDLTSGESKHNEFGPRGVERGSSMHRAMAGPMMGAAAVEHRLQQHHGQHRHIGWTGSPGSTHESPWAQQSRVGPESLPTPDPQELQVSCNS